MNALEAVQLTLLKSALERRQAELSAQAQPAVAAGDLPVPEIETSPADKATVRLLNDLALEAAGMQSAQLRTIRHALSKFADASYGECEQCGNPIGFSRLQARPEACLCIACQTRSERR
jgi:DnaK suppressor protein